MTKEEENETIRAHHLPLRIKQLEEELETTRRALAVYQDSARDQFAMAALTGICANPSTTGSMGMIGPTIAIDAYILADAMLAARDQK